MEEVNNERGLMVCVLNRRENRGACLQRTTGCRRGPVGESERKFCHEPAKVYGIDLLPVMQHWTLLRQLIDLHLRKREIILAAELDVHELSRHVGDLNVK